MLHFSEIKFRILILYIKVTIISQNIYHFCATYRVEKRKKNTEWVFRNDKRN